MERTWEETTLGTAVMQSVGAQPSQHTAQLEMAWYMRRTVHTYGPQIIDLQCSKVDREPAFLMWGFLGSVASSLMGLLARELAPASS